MSYARRNFSLAALLSFLCLPVAAATVYKSTDENGVVTFSDVKPEEDTLVEMVVIDNQARPPSEQEQQRLEQMRETTDRMAADRMAREKHRVDMRQAEAEVLAAQQSQDYSPYYDYGPTIYSSGYGNRRWRRDRPWPEHPVVRPPLLPPGGYRPPVSSFPAPHIRPLFIPKTRGSIR